MPQDRRTSPIREFFKRQYLIDRGFQLRYTVTMMAIWTLSAAVFGCSLAAALIKLTQADVSSFGVALAMLAPTLGVFSVLFIFSILLTHRISGPIYVMSRIVDSLARGEFPTLRPLRKNDEFRDFFQRLGQAVDYLRNKELQEAEKLELLAAALAAKDKSAADELLALAKAKRATSPSSPTVSLSPSPVEPERKAG